MRDREMVAAIVAGDPAGLAAAYDSYAAPLHAYCRSLLAEPADAADAVQDTFLIAAAKLGGLRDRDRLRPWLYAVARNECMRRLRARARTADLDEAGEMTDASADVVTGAERGELQDLVRAAIAGLNPGEREVIELNLRHELDGADLADTLGIPLNQAHALASRARGQLERSLGALLVARTGRAYCQDLASLLAGWNGQLTVLLRKRVSRHIERCDVCGERKRRELSPAMLLSAMPIVLLPPGLRQQVLRLVAGVRPDAAWYRDRVARRAEPFNGSGFPVAISPPAAGSRIRSPAVAYAAVAVLILLVGGGVATAAMLRHAPPANSAAHITATSPAAGSPSASPASAGSSSSGPATSSSPATATPAPSPTLTPATSPTVTPTPTPTPTPTSTPKPRPTATRSRTPKPKPTPTRTKSSPAPTPPVTPGTLEAVPTTVVLVQPPTGAPPSGTFTLTADGGPVASFSITVPKGLSVSPSSGSLKAGQSITIIVTADKPNGPPAKSSTLTLSPGGGTVTVVGRR
jgi:RNA polymerase sigma factor (sigma-70 family)